MATTQPSRPLARREYQIADTPFRAVVTDLPVDGSPAGVTLRVVGPATIQNYAPHFSDDADALGYLASLLSPRSPITADELLAGRITR